MRAVGTQDAVWIAGIHGIDVTRSAVLVNRAALAYGTRYGHNLGKTATAFNLNSPDTAF